MTRIKEPMKNDLQTSTNFNLPKMQGGCITAYICSYLIQYVFWGLFVFGFLLWFLSEVLIGISATILVLQIEYFMRL